MNSDIKNVAAFLAVAIWADGVYATEEKTVLTEIAEALQTDATELTKNVEEALASIQGKEDDEIETFLIEHASAIEEDETRILLQCAIEIILADNVITQDEIQTLFDLADATGDIEHTEVALMIADFVKYNPEVEIKFQ